MIPLLSLLSTYIKYLLLFVIFCYNFDNISRQNGKILLDSKKCEKRPILNIKINAGRVKFQ